MGHDPGKLDGFMGPNTAAAIKSYQTAKGLERSGLLDKETLESLSIGTSVKLVNNVQDWQVTPTQSELDELKVPINNPANAYADYRPNAPAANLDLPGLEILAGMNKDADQFGSRRAGRLKHTQQGH